jgi:succinate dehydrogenase / fumarate reductase membrane anchor subunit
VSKNDSLVNPLAKARGLGSANDGIHHWLQERITAVVITPLLLWLVWSVTHMAGWDHASFLAWLGQPVNAVLMITTILFSFYHGASGAQVIVEDYVHNEFCKLIKVIGIKLFFLVAAIACVFSILKISFGG